MKFVLIGLGVVVGLFILVMVIGSNVSPEIKAEVAAKEAIRAYLKDPGSADFQNVRAHTSAVCGHVNAKNGFGGFTGSKRFIVPTGEAPIIDEGDASPTFLTLWAKYTCYDE